MISKDEYYMCIAEEVLRRSTCLRRKYGAVIVKDDEVISTGYNGSPRGRVNCSNLGTCPRAGVPHGERYELCRSVHAEANAIISAARRDMIGSTLYLAGYDVEKRQYIYDARPCLMCERLIINAGVKKIIVRSHDGVDGFQTILSSDLGYANELRYGKLY